MPAMRPRRSPRWWPPSPPARERGSTRSSEPVRSNSSQPRHGARRLPSRTCRRTFAGMARDHEGGAGTGASMIAKWLLQTLIWIVAMAALLLVPAGTLRWPAAWVFLATLAAIGLSGGWWLARTDPALLAERMRPLMRAE